MGGRIKGIITVLGTEFWAHRWYLASKCKYWSRDKRESLSVKKRLRHAPPRPVAPPHPAPPRLSLQQLQGINSNNIDVKSPPPIGGQVRALTGSLQLPGLTASPIPKGIHAKGLYSSWSYSLTEFQERSRKLSCKGRCEGYSTKICWEEQKDRDKSRHMADQMIL